MVNIIRAGRSSTSPPRNGEVGEIDTRAPFQSVRAAVSLFGMVKAKRPPEKVVVPKKTTPETEGVLDKEAQFHLTQKELEKYKQDWKNAEAIATDALPQLQKATITLDDLKDKLRAVTESKLSILETTEALKMKAEMLEESKTNQQDNADILRNHQDVELSRAEYKAAAAELDAAKQELSKLRSDFSTSVEEKEAACVRAEEARIAEETHNEKVKELSEQIKNYQKSLSRVKRASQNSIQEHDKILADKGSGIEIRRKAKEEAEKKLTTLREEMNGTIPDQDMESKLAQTHAEIKAMEATKASYKELERIAFEDLKAANERLTKLKEEKDSVQAMVDSLSQELQQVQRGISDIKNKEAEAESLKTQLERKKKELEQAIESEQTTASVSEEITLKVEQLLTMTRKAKEEAQDMKQNAADIRRGTKTFEEMTAELREGLDLAIKEAREAREADKRAKEMLHKTKNEANKLEAAAANHPPQPHTTESSTTSESVQVTGGGLPLDCKSKNEAVDQIDAILKEINEIKVATGEALKQAEKAEMAQKIVEDELHRRNQQPQHN